MRAEAAGAAGVIVTDQVGEPFVLVPDSKKFNCESGFERKTIIGSGWIFNSAYFMNNYGIGPQSCLDL